MRVRVHVPIISIAKREEEILVHKTGSQVGLAYIHQLQAEHPSGITVYEDGDVYVVNLRRAAQRWCTQNLRGSAVYEQEAAHAASSYMNNQLVVPARWPSAACSQ